MELPIDVVPGTVPPRFKWKQGISTPAGTQVVEHESSLPPTVEGAVLSLIEFAKASSARLNGTGSTDGALQVAAKLQAFKDWVHAYLDARGVPKEFPDGEHTKCGCRIGDRMDHVFAELEALRELAAQTGTSQQPPAPVKSSSKGKRG